jgi:predicted permease
VPINTALQPDWRVLLYAAAISLLTVFVFGVSPIVQALRTDITRELKGESTSRRLRRWTVRDALVAGQIALSVVLVTSSVLVVRSLQHALTMPIGFKPEGAVSASFDLALQGYNEKQGRAFTTELRQALQAVPAFEAVGLSGLMPLRVGQEDGRALHPGEQATDQNGETTHLFEADSGYLRAMGTRLVAGRNIDPSDREGAPLVALVNQTLAQRLFPHENALGQRIHFAGDPPSQLIQIIGIVEDGKYESLGENPASALFYPLAQHYNGWSTVIVRTQMPAPAALDIIRKTLHSMNPDMPVFNAGSLSDELAFPLFPARVAVTVLGAFGALAVVLAATGLFALVSYSVARRKREIGIRMALGAQAIQVVRSVAGRVALLCGIGIVAGFALLLAGGGAMSALLYGVSPRDLTTHVASAAILIVVAVIACAGPARRAIQIDPASILRAD